MHKALIGAILLSAAAPLAAQSITAASYVPAAAASDLYERLSSQLVLKDARSQGVRAFAEMMMSDHAMTTEKVKKAAAASGVTVGAPKLMPKQQAMIDALRAASGPERERLYLSQQLQAHKEALALHQSYAQSGDAPPLQEVANNAVPVIRAHLEAVQRLETAR